MVHVTTFALGIALRAAAFGLLLTAPLLAVAGTSDSPGHTIEAPTAPKTGVGLVLLVSLQRA